MSNKDGGGAAFPSAGVVIDYDKNEHQQGAYEGMSLRDYFAAKAMQGMIADTNILTGIMSDRRIMAGQLYDAGYRKFKIVDN